MLLHWSACCSHVLSLRSEPLRCAAWPVQAAFETIRESHGLERAAHLVVRTLACWPAEFRATLGLDVLLQPLYRVSVLCGRLTQ